MEIQKLTIDEIKPAKYNPRLDLQSGDIEYEKIKRSIVEFDLVEPLVVNKRTGNLVGGHQRLKVLQELGRTEVEAVIVDLSESREKALNIALNKAQGDWDLPKLKDLLLEIDTGEFDIEITGFNEKEIEDLMNQLFVPEENEKDDDVPEVPEEPITKKGDLYKLGEHRLLCGDCLNIENIDKLLNGKTANVLITDPPYGVDYSSKNDFLNKFDKGNGNQTAIKNDAIESYKDFFTTFLINLKDKFDNTFYVFISGKEISNLIQAIQDCSYHFAQEIVWVKNNHVLGRMDYQPKHENIVYGWQNTHKFFGGFQTSVIEYPKPLKSDLHPTMKPVELLSKLIQDSTLMNNIVIDLFGGSGSTLIACEKLNRKCFMMELDEHYCDVIVKRWEDYTGKKAELLNEILT